MGMDDYFESEARAKEAIGKNAWLERSVASGIREYKAKERKKEEEQEERWRKQSELSHAKFDAISQQMEAERREREAIRRSALSPRQREKEDKDKEKYKSDRIALINEINKLRDARNSAKWQCATESSKRLSNRLILAALLFSIGFLFLGMDYSLVFFCFLSGIGVVLFLRSAITQKKYDDLNPEEKLEGDCIMTISWLRDIRSKESIGGQ